MGLDMYLGMRKDTRFIEMGYWRKSNAIHNWFVNTLANGVDECQEIPVTVDDLKELRDLCNKVKDNNELAPNLLPTTTGFFFGNTSYDEGYFNDINYTLDILEPLIENHADKEFVYQASW